MKNNYTACSISALLCAIPFIFPRLWPLEFFFLLPIFIYALKNKLGWKQGFCWGIVFFGIHNFGLSILIVQHGFGFLRFFIPILYILYCSLFSGFWFFSAAQASKYLRRYSSNIYISSCLWIIATFFYFLAIDRLLFIIFGSWDGNTLALPILPIISEKIGVVLVQMLGANIVVLLLISMQMSIAIFWRNYVQAITIFGCLMLYLTNAFLPHKSCEKPVWLNCIAALYPPPAKQLSTYEKFQTLEKNMLKLCAEKDMLTCIICPESTLPLALNEYPEKLKEWSETPLKDLSIIVGAHRKTGSVFFNCSYLIQDCRITQFYDKRKPLFFTEKLPLYCENLAMIRSLFLRNSIIFSSGASLPSSFVINHECHLMPIICSELFLSSTDEIKNSDIPLVALVNDSWFAVSYVQYLLELCAQLKAISWKKDIVYVSHTRALWISKSGQRCIL